MSLPTGWPARIAYETSGLERVLRSSVVGFFFVFGVGVMPSGFNRGPAGRIPAMHLDRQLPGRRCDVIDMCTGSRRVRRIAAACARVVDSLTSTRPLDVVSQHQRHVNTWKPQAEGAKR